MLSEIKKIPAFVIRDFRILFTYKLAFFSFTFNIVFTLFHLVLFGSMFNTASSAVLSPYGNDFISYIVIGSIGWAFLWSIMTATSLSLRNEMMMGTLESIIITPTKTHTIIFAYVIYGCLFGVLSMIILFIVGILFFDIFAFTSAGIFTLIIFILSATMMMGLGFVFSGLTIWIKNIGETVPILQNIVMFFCGVYFPITVLPEFLQPVANIMPFYYSIEGLRLSMLPKTPQSELLYYTWILLILSIIFMAIGLIVLKKGLIKAKKDGSLGFY